MAEPHREILGRAGRLVPRWVQDLFEGNLADTDADVGDIFTKCGALPQRLCLSQTDRAANGEETSHALLAVETQCVGAPHGQRMSFMCKSCKYHFVVDVVGTGTNCCPSSTGFPMCHLVLKSSEPTPVGQDLDKFNPVTHAAKWMCSASSCQLTVSVTMSRPRLKVEDVKWMVDENRVRLQRQEAARADPERFATLPEGIENKALVTLNAYLRDILGSQTSPEPKKVAMRNKVFAVQFGPQAQPIFQYLGFDERTIDADKYWVLPQLPTAQWPTQVGTTRAFYEDTKHEVVALIEETGQNMSLPSQPDPKTRLKQALGYQDNPHAPIPRPGDDPRDFKLLGTTIDSDDDTLKFAFQCQTETDPARMAEYCNALQRLAEPRGPDLQLFAVTKASLVESTQAQQKTPKDPLEEAYLHFGLDPTGVYTYQDLLLVYQTKREQTPSQGARHSEMLFRIGRARDDNVLIDAACDLHTYEAACQFLDVGDLGPQPEAEGLISFANAQIKNGKEPRLVAAALDTIADQINTPESARIRDAAQTFRNLEQQLQPVSTGRMETDFGPPADSIPVDLSIPPGLDNLRNTCYLNSILQYFFTVKAIREIVLSFDPSQLPPNEETTDNAEIYLGREFVVELKKLFLELLETPAQFVKPRQRLANAAWISVEKVQQDKARQIHQAWERHQPTTDTGDKPPPVPPPLPARPVPPVPSQEQSQNPAVSAPEHSETSSVSSGLTLISPQDVSSGIPQMDLDKAAGRRGEHSVTPVELTGMDDDGNPDIGREVEMTNGIDSVLPSTSTPVEEISKAAEKLSPKDLIEAIEEALNQTEIKGTEQMDVEEVMGRCINHLRVAINPSCATNPNATDGNSDKIKDSLFITLVNSRKGVSAPEYNRNVNEERWVTAIPGSSGSVDLHTALGNYFDLEIIGNTLLSFASIAKAPPIFHICIQRSQVGGGKNTNPIAIPDVLYLDRYMEVDEDSAAFRARRRSWDIEHQMKDTQSDTAPAASAGTVNQGDTLGPEDDAAILDFITGNTKGDTALDRGDNSSNDNIISNPGTSSQDTLSVKYDAADILRRLERDASGHVGSDSAAHDDIEGDAQGTEDEIEMLPDVLSPRELNERASIEKADLQKELETLFEGFKTYQYRLHSVICHAGQTAKSGHYWVWIYDFEQQVWRKYNDRRVTEERDSQVVLTELATKGEPYYLMYVRDQDKHDLVSVPRRAQREPEPDADAWYDVDMADYSGPENVPLGTKA
ncbi:hypothetical protein VTK73DRAFT_10121 [Phialemonium thermophilum]|uniref:ubiquitinyl hydrolase 1 n=1 Tax=Phialemonium thermophilum TaxID=223376 RepID=A0ABR3XI26_9PEZI